MIVARDAAGLVLVRQVDHQEQCGLMADAWGNADFARPEPFGPVRAAATWHDEGWRAWEDAPRAAAGAPVNFTAMDRPTHVGIYRAGIAEARARDPREGLLVSMHGRGLYEYTAPADRDPMARAFIAEQAALQEELRAELGGGAAVEAWASAGFRLVRAWDALSLYLTWRGLGDGRPGVLPQVPREVGDPGVDLHMSPDGPGACILMPWPFSAPVVELPVRARRIADRPYAGDGDLADALAAAAWVTLAFRVRPAPGHAGRPHPEASDPVSPPGT